MFPTRPASTSGPILASAPFHGTFFGMVSYDNPAGRLHALLEALSGVAGSTPTGTAWSQVLDVPTSEGPLQLAAVGQLVGDVEQAVETAGATAFSATVSRYRDEWLNAVFPSDQGLSGGIGNVMPSAVALEALAGIATHLHTVAPEGKVPEIEELEELKQRVQDTLHTVEQAADLPDAVKELIVARLSGVLQAITHVAVGGPHAVRFATEALVGAIVAEEPARTAASRSSTVKQVLATLGVVWVAFSAGPTVQNSIEAWGELFRGELTSGATNRAESDPADRGTDPDRVDEPTPERGPR